MFIVGRVQEECQRRDRRLCMCFVDMEGLLVDCWKG